MDSQLQDIISSETYKGYSQGDQQIVVEEYFKESFGDALTPYSPEDREIIFKEYVKENMPQPEAPETSISGLASSFGLGLAEGVTTELPSLIGGAVEFAGSHLPESLSAVKDIGKSLREWSEGMRENLYGPQKERSGLENIVYEGSKMFAPSVIPGSVATMGVRALKGIGGLVKAAKAARLAGDVAKADKLITLANKAASTANKIGAASVAGIFGGSQAQSTIDVANQRIAELEKQGKYEEAQKVRESAGGMAPYVTGAIEGAGEYFGTKYLGKLLRLDEAGIVKRGAKNTVKDFLKTLGVEVGTEVGQQAGQAGVEKYTGIRPDADPLAEALDVVGPVIFMTMLTGGVGAAVPRKTDMQQDKDDLDTLEKEEGPFADKTDQKRQEIIKKRTGIYKAQERRQREIDDITEFEAFEESGMFDPAQRMAETEERRRAATEQARIDHEQALEIKREFEARPRTYHSEAPDPIKILREEERIRRMQGVQDTRELMGRREGGEFEDIAPGASLYEQATEAGRKLKEAGVRMLDLPIDEKARLLNIIKEYDESGKTARKEAGIDYSDLTPVGVWVEQARGPNAVEPEKPTEANKETPETLGWEFDLEYIDTANDVSTFRRVVDGKETTTSVQGEVSRETLKDAIDVQDKELAEFKKRFPKPEKPVKKVPGGATQGLSQTMKTIGSIQNAHLTKHPSGKWGYVGSVDSKLAFESLDGKPPTDDQLKKIVGAQSRAMAMKAAGIKTRVWENREDALKAAHDLGITVQEGNKKLVPPSSSLVTDVAGEGIEGEPTKQEAKKPEVEITPKATGKTVKTYTGNNQEIEVEYALFDINDLVPSHDIDLNVNPNFPKDLQPRDRSRNAMRLQIESIANNINPERLGESASITSGAPIIGPDGVVEAGNGRIIALKKAYGMKKKADTYRAWLEDKAFSFDFKMADLKKIDTPVLVRIRKTKVDRKEFSRQANQGEIAGMSPTEQARVDADRFDEGDIELFRPTEDGVVTARSNQAFVDRFLDSMSKNEAAALVSADGSLNRTGTDRIKAAIFHKAYNDASLTSIQAEEVSTEAKNLINALTMAAGDFGRARNVEGYDNIDIAPHIVEATKLILKSRKSGDPLNMVLKQRGMFDKIDPLAEKLALFFDSNIRSGKRMGATLKTMARRIRNDLIDSGQGGLFEAKKLPTKLEVIEEEIRNAEGKTDTQRGLFGQVAEGGDRGGERIKYQRARFGSAKKDSEGRVTYPEGSYDTVLKELSEIKIPTFNRPTQLSLDFTKKIREEAKEQAIPRVQRTRMVTTGSILAAGNVVQNENDAASLLAVIRKEAQEVAYTLAVDDKNRVIEIHKYTKGLRGKSQISPVEVAGRVLNVGGVKKVYFVHNHPSGDPTASQDDVGITNQIRDIFSLQGIPVTSLVIGEQTYQTFDERGPSYSVEKIRPQARVLRLPIVERKLRRGRDYKKSPRILNSRDADRYFIDKLNDAEGILFLTHKNKVIGFMPWPKGLKYADAAAKILAHFEKFNASAAIINLKGSPSTTRIDFLSNLFGSTREVAWHDVRLDGVSLADAGKMKAFHDRAVPGEEFKNLREGGVLFSKRKTSHHGTITVTEIEKGFESILKKWKNAPKINIVQSQDDLPGSILSQAGEKDIVDGAFSDGTVYLVADNLGSVDNALNTLMHEAVGHYGFRGLFEGHPGLVRRYRAILNRIRLAKAKEIKAIAEERGLDLKNTDDGLLAAEEYLANEAVAGTDSPWVDRAIRIIRDFLRAAGVKLKISDAEIRAWISDAQRFVEKGPGVQRGRTKPAAFSYAGGKAKSADRMDLTPEQGIPKEDVIVSMRGGEQQSVEAGPLSEAEDQPGILRHAWNELVYQAQDRFNYLNMVQSDALKKKRISELPENQDAYLAEIRYHGMSAAVIDDIEENHITPLIESMTAAEISVDETEEYLHARHAPEANKRLKNLNPDSAEINRRIQAVQKERTAVVAERAQIRKADPNKYPINKRYRNLEIKKDALQNDINRLKGYSPRKDNKALSGMTDEKAAEILARIERSAKVNAYKEIGTKFDAITKAHRDLLRESGLEKNETIDAWEKLYKFYAPLYREGHDRLPVKGRGFDIRGKQPIRTGSTKDVTNILTRAVANYEAAAIRAEKAKVGRAFLEFARENPGPWEINKIEYKPTISKDGLVVYRPASTLLDDNVLSVRIDGEDYHVSFDRTDHDAMRIASAFKNLNSGDSGPLVNIMSRFTRYLAIINTGLNPEFIISNFARDIQTAGYNMADSEADKVRIKSIKQVGKAWKGIRQFQKGNKDTEWSKYYDKFRKAGAQTGWIEAYANIEGREKKLIKMIKSMKPGKMETLKRGTRAIMDFVNNQNTAVENAIRLSTFKNLVESGVSEAKSARIAKELTVNFNRKGNMGQALNALYLFYNASVQGSARIIAAGAKSSKVRKMMGATIAFAAALDILNRTMGGDDDDDVPQYDKIAPWVKERNLIIMLPSGYAKIPLPWGYNVFHVIGQVAGEMLTKDKFNAIDGTKRIAGSVIRSFNPIGGEESLLQMLSPTMTDPVVQWAENKDWTGRKLRPDTNIFAPKPDSQTYWSSVREPSKYIAEKINEITGGDEIRPGAIDISPELIDLVVDTYTGGAGRFAANMVSAPIKAIKGESVEAHEIPMARRIYGKSGNQALTHAFYENMDSVRLVDRQLKHYKGDKEKLKEIKSKYYSEIRMVNRMKATRKMLSYYRKKEPSDKKTQKIKDLMVRFNKHFALREFKEEVIEQYTKTRKRGGSVSDIRRKLKAYNKRQGERGEATYSWSKMVAAARNRMRSERRDTELEKRIK